jgi:putative ABC transport system ATP-binding protein
LRSICGDPAQQQPEPSRIAQAVVMSLSRLSSPASEATARSLVVASGVTKCFRPTEHALQDVSLEIRRRRMLAITGRSGSGKTTLLHCLSGVSVPDSGRIMFDGMDLVTSGDRDRSALRRKWMSFVFQRSNLDPALTVRENAGLALVLQGVPRRIAVDRVDGALEQMGLVKRASSFPHELSGGEAQRVALARAIAAQPAVVWADEPTGALDRGSSSQVLTALRGLCDAGSTVVVVTHDADVAASADDLVQLEDGRRIA